MHTDPSAGDGSARPRLRIIVGTTASGKERLALAVARRVGGEIVSVDSMKVYRGLDIATAKAGPEERALVPHHCLDLADMTETFSAADFVRAAEDAIQDIVRRGRVPILSGGTAFYYKALLEGLFEGPPADTTLRAELEHRAAVDGAEVLHEELREKDPVAAGKIHPSDIRRIIRALEVHALTGRPISDRQREWANFHSEDVEQRRRGFFATPRYPFTMIRIVRDRDDTRARVAERISRMAANGLRDEAEMVWRERDRVSRTPLQAVGYKEFFPYFTGEASWDEAVERLRLATNKLVRSQDTWFRKFPATEVRMTPDSRTDEVAEQVADTVLF